MRGREGEWESRTKLGATNLTSDLEKQQSSALRQYRAKQINITTGQKNNKQKKIAEIYFEIKNHFCFYLKWTKNKKRLFRSYIFESQRERRTWTKTMVFTFHEVWNFLFMLLFLFFLICCWENASFWNDFWVPLFRVKIDLGNIFIQQKFI